LFRQSSAAGLELPFCPGTCLRLPCLEDYSLSPEKFFGILVHLTMTEESPEYFQREPVLLGLFQGLFRKGEAWLADEVFSWMGDREAIPLPEGWIRKGGFWGNVHATGCLGPPKD
jgi:hypothetical protein